MARKSSPAARVAGFLLGARSTRSARLPVVRNWRLPFAAATPARARKAGHPLLERVRHLLLGPSASRHEYLITRWLFLRLLGVVYFTAFASLWPQLRGLIGRNGILPAADFLASFRDPLSPQRYWQWPTLAWLNTSDAFLHFVCGSGLLASLLLIVGIAPVPALVVLWVSYLSLVNVGQDFLSFQWDVLLLETGFLAIFFAPLQILPRLSRESPPSRTVLWLLRWLLFRLMFFSGVVKLASRDATWRGLSALTFHYETQPLPTPVAWYVHQLPPWFHRFSAVVMFAIELGVPFLIFAPRRARFASAAALVWLQLLIILTGNYAFFNLLSIVLCIVLLDDTCVRYLVPARLRGNILISERRLVPSIASRFLFVPLATVILLLSGLQIAGRYAGRANMPQPIRSIAGRLDPFHVVNSYGLFAVMTTSRPEIVVEGSNDGQTWVEYTFPYKPGDVYKRPPWVAPHQPRLDWQMWFAALGSPWGNRWFANFLLRLLEGSPEVLSLLQTNPFPDAPPRYVRALLYDYRFTHTGTAESDGAWWRREYRGIYFPAVSLQNR